MAWRVVGQRTCGGARDREWNGECDGAIEDRPQIRRELDKFLPRSRNIEEVETYLSYWQQSLVCSHTTFEEQGTKNI